MTLADDVMRVFERELPRLVGAPYESRQQQVDMALAVADAIERDRVAVVEAETGLGKSLAYLIPVILYSQATGARAVVATYTKTLQRQLSGKDFRLAARACGDGVQAAVLMGRTSYACRRAVTRRLEGDVDDEACRQWLAALLADDAGDLEAQPGSSDHLDERMRTALSCPSNETVCSGCPLRESCFLYLARRRALASQVVITNHAMLFSNLAVDGALLGPYDTLVADEAHHLDDVATQFLTVSFSRRSIRGSRESVYSPEYDQTAAAVRERLALRSPDQARAFEALWAEFHQAMGDADGEAARLFELIGAGNLRAAAGDVNGSAEPPQRVAYAEGAPLLYGTTDAAALGCAALERMARCAEGAEAIVSEHGTAEDADAAVTLRSVAGAAREAAERLRFVVAAGDDEYVFYASLREGRSVTALSAAPVDVGPRLESVFDDNAAVLTSATLAVGDDFGYVLDHVGLASSRRVDTHRFETPFDLGANRRVIVASALPEPASPEFVGSAGDLLAEVLRGGRRMLVLATSYRQADAVAQRLAGFEFLRGRVFAQTGGGARADLLSRFVRTRGAVLVGLASFWEGVDLPGEALEVVAILKLPFLVPTEPVVSARAGRLSALGENPFEKLFVPDVVLKLRQGMGRLIRAGSDRGAVILLDRRLTTAPYGATILDAVAGEFVRCETSALVAQAVRGAFDTGLS